MKKDKELWQFIGDRLKPDCSVILLIVVESSGSSPGQQGFKMAVTDGELMGSIGGGVMEVSLVELARRRVQSSLFRVQSPESEVQSPESRVIRQVHQKDSPNSSGMICSGEQTVILFQITPGDLDTIVDIASAISENRPSNLTITESKIVISEGNLNEPLFRYEEEKDGEFIYKEPLNSGKRLFIVGGGHCALALSEFMSKLDFRISLFDDRPDLNTIAKNKFADEIHILEDYREIGDYVSSGEHSGEDHYVVVMTLGYKSDKTVIRELLDKEFKYIGVLGSKAKMKTLLRELEHDGCSKTRLDSIHTPIGVAINSRTPEEIAISIAAEIIAVKNKKD